MIFRTTSGQIPKRINVMRPSSLYLVILLFCIASCQSVTSTFDDPSGFYNERSTYIERYLTEIPQFPAGAHDCDVFVYRRNEASVYTSYDINEAKIGRRKIQIGEIHVSDYLQGSVNVFAPGSTSCLDVFRILASLPEASMYHLYFALPGNPIPEYLVVDGSVLGQEPYSDSVKIVPSKIKVSMGDSKEVTFTIDTKEGSGYIFLSRECRKRGQNIPLPRDTYWYFEIVFNNEVTWETTMKVIAVLKGILLGHPKVICRFYSELEDGIVFKKSREDQKKE